MLMLIEKFRGLILMCNISFFFVYRYEIANMSNEILFQLLYDDEGKKLPRHPKKKKLLGESLAKCYLGGQLQKDEINLDRHPRHC